MVGQDLGDQGQAETAAAALAADERLEQVLDHVRGHARAIVAHLDRDRQLQPVAAVVHRHPQPVLILGRQRDRAACRRCGLGRVLDQVQEHLHQPVAVTLDLGQRGVVELDEAVLAGEAGLAMRRTCSST